MQSNMIANIRIFSDVKVNTLSNPPGKYYRKIGTQRNWRGSTQVVEHVV